MGHARKRITVALSDGRTRKSPCSNCGVLLSAWVQAQPLATATSTTRLKGHRTVCAYCGALLVFADDNGTLRTMTPEERATWNPGDEERRVFEVFRKFAGDFTKRRFR